MEYSMEYIMAYTDPPFIITETKDVLPSLFVSLQSIERGQCVD